MSSTLISLVVAGVAASGIGTLTHSILNIPVQYTSIISALAFLSIYVLASNQLSSDISNRRNDVKSRANAAYEELTGDSGSAQQAIAAAKKKKNKASKAASNKASEVSERVSNAASSVKDTASAAATNVAESASAAGAGAEPSSKKKKKRSKKQAAAETTTPPAATVQQHDEDDDGDGTLDIAHHPSLSGTVSGGKSGKGAKKALPVISKPASSQQQPSKPKTESEAAVAKREAQQAVLKARIESEKRQQAEAEKRQQQQDAAEGWTQTVSAASRKKDDSQQTASTQQANVSNEATRSEMPVDSKYQALIIGPKGKHLSDIQQGTGARIQMPGRDSGNNVIVVTGTAAQVQYATAMINSLVTRGYSSLTHPNTVHDDINIPDTKLGVVIGPGGANIKTIQLKTNTRINLPERGTNGKTYIIGSKDGVKAARQALKQLMSEGFSTLTHEGHIREEVEFPTDKHAYLIGPKGHTIKSIQGNTQTKIHLPAPNNPSKNVVVTGPEQGVKQAIKEIRRLLVPREAAAVSAEGDFEEGEEMDAELQQYAYTAPSTNAWAAPVAETKEEELWE